MCATNWVNYGSKVVFLCYHIRHISSSTFYKSIWKLWKYQVFVRCILFSVCQVFAKSLSYVFFYIGLGVFILPIHLAMILIISLLHLSSVIKSEIWVIITMTSWWTRRRLKSPASQLFTQPFTQAQIKESIKAPRHWRLCGEFTGDRIKGQ